MWGRGLKQRETRDINIQPKARDFGGFFEIFDATPAGVLVPEEDTLTQSITIRKTTS
ncbi:hypothetical protein SOQ14_06115 [Erythrobacter sp. T5W1-R]|uniref:hypothetical protein n=1 Tax=Erythrobacter sp. T5W1-R TaxID=3101752 RepID=UPI002AFF2E0B|nr:hypothetical protein [Erythrobacter sp. T5W1-R]MEA1618486.1 hypothetical protein [Erythrobacter sp. T5W1-R]